MTNKGLASPSRPGTLRAPASAPGAGVALWRRHWGERQPSADASQELATQRGGLRFEGASKPRGLTPAIGGFGLASVAWHVA